MNDHIGPFNQPVENDPALSRLDISDKAALSLAEIEGQR